MRVSLRYRLLGPPLLLLAGVAGATAWAAATAAAHAEERIARQISAVAHTLTEPPAFPLTPRVLEQMKGLSGAEYLLVEKTGGRISTFPADPGPPPAVPEVTPTPALGPPVTVGGEEYRGLRVAHRDGDLFVFYPESLRRAAVADAVRPALLLGLGAGLAAVLLAAATAGRLVRRVRAVEARTRDIAAGHFEPMPLPAADDELRDLCRSVNEMARRLADYQQSLAAGERLRVLGQFAGGLAHQLRNAATGAKLAVELHAIDCPADREPLAVALRQLARIEANLRQFLELGRPPARRDDLLDLRNVIASAVELLGPQCRHAGTALLWEPPPDPVPLRGDAVQLGHLVANLLGNAAEAAGPGGEVVVRLLPGVIEVEDTGPGPPADIADRLFDPFVTGREQGIGLGLSVAKQAAESHGGRITWERRGGRTVFAAHLPTADNKNDEPIRSQPGA